MERIQKSTSSDNSQGYFHVTLLVSRDIILLDNTLQKRKTLDKDSLLLSDPNFVRGLSFMDILILASRIKLFDTSYYAR